MTKPIAALALVLAIAGCATARERRGVCDASALQRFVGAIGTAEVGRSLLASSRATTLRWIPPGAMVTMDMRPDRLNVGLDGRNFVTAVDCG